MVVSINMGLWLMKHENIQQCNEIKLHLSTMLRTLGDGFYELAQQTQS